MLQIHKFGVILCTLTWQRERKKLEPFLELLEILKEIFWKQRVIYTNRTYKVGNFERQQRKSCLVYIDTNTTQQIGRQIISNAPKVVEKKGTMTDNCTFCHQSIDNFTNFSYENVCLVERGKKRQLPKPITTTKYPSMYQIIKNLLIKINLSLFFSQTFQFFF